MNQNLSLGAALPQLMVLVARRIHPAGSIAVNGIVDTDERYDGNLLGGYGCSSRCIIEGGFVCPMSGGSCGPVRP